MVCQLQCDVSDAPAAAFSAEMPVHVDDRISTVTDHELKFADPEGPAAGHAAVFGTVNRPVGPAAPSAVAPPGEDEDGARRKLEYDALLHQAAELEQRVRRMEQEHRLAQPPAWTS